jgi:catechol 2,3-dioxygenase-like lactoylglutathione lyase family enzyme
MLIRLATVFVDDQDRAKAFYTEKLGFVLVDDNAYGPGLRWLSVASAEEPDGTRLLLNAASGPAADYQKAVYAAGKPAIAFISRDLRADYEKLKARGVTFLMKPTVLEYGGTDATLDDTCGNIICLHQA